MKKFFVNLYESMPGHVVARGPIYADRGAAQDDVIPQEKTLFLGTFEVQVEPSKLTIQKDGLIVPNRQQC